MWREVNVMWGASLRQSHLDLDQLVGTHALRHVPAQMKRFKPVEWGKHSHLLSATRQQRPPSSPALITIITKLRLHAATNSFHSGHFSALLIFKTLRKHTDRTLEEQQHNPHCSGVSMQLSPAAPSEWDNKTQMYLFCFNCRGSRRRQDGAETTRMWLSWPRIVIRH